MRVLTWNLDGRAPAEPTWAYIASALRPDVTFAQEATGPPVGPGISPGQWRWAEIGENSRFGADGRYWWATGIYARSGRLAPMEFPSLGQGWVVGARLDLGGRHLTLINVHIELDTEGLSTTTLTRIITELADVLRDPNVIFGGDLNVDPLIDEVYGGHRHSEVLDLLREHGLFHVNSLLPPGTRTNAESKHPYQIDHLFVSESLREAVDDVQVIVGSRIRSLSDHYPLLMELSLEGPTPARS